MRLSGGAHLTYCTNVHPGESWAEVKDALERHVLGVKAIVAPARDFGVGLRLSARAALEVSEPRELESLKEWLGSRGLYVFTINGFPYGAFHGRRVKEEVFRPDWLEEPRLEYTDRLARILCALLPGGSGLEGSISTVPGAWRARAAGSDGAEERIAELLVRHAAALFRIVESTGKVVTLALEPEPQCLLDTVAETVGFFERRLFTRASAARLSELTGLGAEESEAFLRRHLGVCFDACHMAVGFEDPGEALGAFRSAGIRVLKIQISAGLRVPMDGPGGHEALRLFSEDVYLHQVVKRDAAGRITRHPDLPEALEDGRGAGARGVAAAAGGAGGKRPADDRAAEWRVHFHVPIFTERLGPFHTTQEHLRSLCAILRSELPTRHLEVETYTWDVLPPEHRCADIVSATARELAWAMEQLER